MLSVSPTGCQPDDLVGLPYASCLASGSRSRLFSLSINFCDRYNAISQKRLHGSQVVAAQVARVAEQVAGVAEQVARVAD